MKTIITTIYNFSATRRCIGLFLLVVLLFLGVLYMYLVTSSIVHVVMRKEANQNIQALESEIATLENRFMLAQHQISDVIVANREFIETNQKIFVYRDKASTVAVSRD